MKQRLFVSILHYHLRYCLHNHLHYHLRTYLRSFAVSFCVLVCVSPVLYPVPRPVPDRSGFNQDAPEITSRFDLIHFPLSQIALDSVRFMSLRKYKPVAELSFFV